jgi:hypothetical protein
MLNTKSRRALQLRELSKNILAMQGRLVLSAVDGCHFWTISDDEFRIELQPAIACSATPTWLDISRRGKKVFTLIWFADPRHGATKVLLDETDCDLEIELRSRWGYGDGDD